MQAYSDIDGESNVLSYLIGEDYIIVKFAGIQRMFVYSYKKAGREHVENMKIMAQLGNGLESYIKDNVKGLYD